MAEDLISLAGGIGLSGGNVSGRSYIPLGINGDCADGNDNCDCFQGDCYCTDCNEGSD
ncbi:MAG: hypothetical protein KKF50_00265 [Nanoarchaeota archaeon]|nr:hypothetical protein [Nanoarchaeota archaeon]